MIRDVSRSPSSPHFVDVSTGALDEMGTAVSAITVAEGSTGAVPIAAAGSEGRSAVRRAFPAQHIQRTS